MPAMIPTPWIRAYDPAQEFLGGYGHGAQVAEANARIAQASQSLQAQEQEAAMRHELAKRQLDQQGLIHSQQLEISRAYHEATIGMQKQKLAEAQKMNDMKIKQYADMSAGRMEISKRIAAGEDPNQVIMEVGPRAFGSSSAAEAAALKIAEQRQAKLPTKWVPPDTVTGAPGYMVDSKGNIHFPTGQQSQGKMDQFVKAKFDEAKKAVDRIEAKIINDDLLKRPNKLKELRDAEKPYKEAMNAIYKDAGRKDLPYPELENERSAGKYDAQGNYIPATESTKEEPSFLSDVWKSIKGAPAAAVQKALGIPDTGIVGAALGKGEDAAPEQKVIPQAPVAPPEQVPSWPPQEQGEQQFEAFPAPVVGSLGAPAAAPAPAQQNIPAGLLSPVTPAFGLTSQPQASIPAAMAQAPQVSMEEKVLNAWRGGEISKTEAMKALGKHIIGPEWVTSKVKSKWHWGMAPDDSGKMSHVYRD